MFTARSGEIASNPEIEAIPQAQIDEAIAADIYRLACLVEEKEAFTKLDTLCVRAMFAFVKDRFGVDPTQVRTTSGAYIVPISPKQNARLYIEEVYSGLDQQRQAAHLTISFTVSIDGGQRSASDHMTLEASLPCVHSIIKKLREHEEEQERQEQADRALLEQLLPHAINFARQHPFERLNAHACEPIADFIEAFLGGTLKPNETLQMIRRDYTEPAWEFIRYRGEEVQDIHQFSE